MPETRFSAYLQKHLDRERLNYSSLAHIIGVGPNTARAWCIGQSEPSPEHVLKLAKTLRVDPAEMHRLLGWLPQEGELKDSAAEMIAQKITQLAPGDREVVEALVRRLEAHQRLTQEQ
jgi:transcriptional regulator with XRE-family HTH domain